MPSEGIHHDDMVACRLKPTRPPRKRAGGRGEKGLLMGQNKELKYIPLNCGDFLADQNVALMSTEQVGAYILLLLYAWGQNPAGTIPNNDEWLCAWARTTPKRWQEIKEGVLRPFVLNDSEDRWEQARMRDTYIQVKKSLDEKSANGRKAAKARWEASSDCNADALLNSKLEIENRENTTTKRSREKMTWGEHEGWSIPESIMAIWKQTYQIDIDKELALMNSWLLCNPDKRYKQWKRFANAWLNRSQERKNQKGNNSGNHGNAEYEECGIGSSVDVRRSN